MVHLMISTGTNSLTRRFVTRGPATHLHLSHTTP